MGQQELNFDQPTPQEDLGGPKTFRGLDFCSHCWFQVHYPPSLSVKHTLFAGILALRAARGNWGTSVFETAFLSSYGFYLRCVSGTFPSQRFRKYLRPGTGPRLKKVYEGADALDCKFKGLRFHIPGSPKPRTATLSPVC